MILQGRKQVGATFVHGVFRENHITDIALEAQHVVPDNLFAILRNREGDCGVGTGDAVAVSIQCNASGGLFDVVIIPLRETGTASCRVDMHPEFIRVCREHRLGSFRNLVGILGHIIFGYREQLFIAGIGVRAGVTLFPTRKRRGIAPLPGRNCAVGITGLFGTHRGEIFAQAGGFFGRHSGRCKARGSQKRQTAYRCNRLFHHSSNSLYLKVIAALIRFRICS